MVVAVPHPTIARDHCLAPTRSIDAPMQGASGKYEHGGLGAARAWSPTCGRPPAGSVAT